VRRKSVISVYCPRVFLVRTKLLASKQLLKGLSDADASPDDYFFSAP